MPEIEIRPAVSTDIPSLVKFEHFTQTAYVWQMERLIEEGQVSITFREVHLPRPVRLEYSRDQNDLIEGWKSLSWLLVAFLSGEPVGYIGVMEVLPSKTASVVHLVVREKVRRQGIGTALVLATQDLARARDLRRVVLEMQSKNYPAIKMATKLGYDFCGYNDHYYSNQDIALFFGRYLK